MSGYRITVSGLKICFFIILLLPLELTHIYFTDKAINTYDHIISLRKNLFWNRKLSIAKNEINKTYKIMCLDIGIYIYN